MGKDRGGGRMGEEEGTEEGGGGDRGWGRTEDDDDDDDDDKKAHELESLAQALNEDEGDIEMVVTICPLSASAGRGGGEEGIFVGWHCLLRDLLMSKRQE